MPEHQTPLIATIAAGLMLAYVFGLLAHGLDAGDAFAGDAIAGDALAPRPDAGTGGEGP